MRLGGSFKFQIQQLLERKQIVKVCSPTSWHIQSLHNLWVTWLHCRCQGRFLRASSELLNPRLVKISQAQLGIRSPDLVSSTWEMLRLKVRLQAGGGSKWPDPQTQELHQLTHASLPSRDPVQRPADQNRLCSRWPPDKGTSWFAPRSGRGSGWKPCKRSERFRKEKGER